MEVFEFLNQIQMTAQATAQAELKLGVEEKIKDKETVQ
jgi:hypothetical protein